MSKDKKKGGNGFTKAPNNLLWDNTLTLEEKAFLLIMESNIKDWKTMITEIYSRSDNTEDSQRKVINALIGKGYMKKIDNRTPSNRKFNYSYEHNLNGNFKVEGGKPPMEKPYTESPSMETSDTEKPSVEVPHSENPDTNNTTTNNTIGNNTISNQNIENSISKEESPVFKEEKKDIEEIRPPSFEEVKVFFESNGYNVAGASAFFNEFNKRNWYSLNGTKVYNWKGMAKDYFIKSKMDFFQLNDEMEEFIKERGAQLFQIIHFNVYEQREQIGDEHAHLKFSKSDVISAFKEAIIKHRLDTKQKVIAHFEKNKIDKSRFGLFKKSLGLSSAKSSGKKYGNP